MVDLGLIMSGQWETSVMYPSDVGTLKIQLNLIPQGEARRGQVNHGRASHSVKVVKSHQGLFIAMMNMCST